MKKILAVMLMLSCVILCGCEENTDDFEITYSDETAYEYEETPAESEPEEPAFSSEGLPDPVKISADFDVTTNPDGTFVIETNLPDETELSLTLKGRGYLAQGKAYVKDGVGISERFTNQGKQLVGEYTLEVLMPIPSVQSEYVKHFIGENGEYLTGPYIKGALGSVVVSKEFKVSFFDEEETTSEKTSKPVASNTSSSGKSYYRTPSGTKYHLDPDCGGKNSYATTNISGLSPCKKCAQ